MLRDDSGLRRDRIKEGFTAKVTHDWAPTWMDPQDFYNPQGVSKR